MIMEAFGSIIPFRRLPSDSCGWSILDRLGSVLGSSSHRSCGSAHVLCCAFHLKVAPSTFQGHLGIVLERLGGVSGNKRSFTKMKKM